MIDGHETCRSEMDILKREISELRDLLEQVGSLAYAASSSADQARWVMDSCRKAGVFLEDSDET